MSDEVTEGTEAATESGLSRRNALRAGAAVGVGAVAWSGVTITSLGGTPAYAQTTSGVIPPIELNAQGRCRNIDGGAPCPNAAPYRWHALNSEITVEGFPAGSFSINPNIPEGTCCGSGATATFNFPAGLTCTVRQVIWETNPQCNNPLISTPKDERTLAPESDGTILIDFPCMDAMVNDKYSITAFCTDA